MDAGRWDRASGRPVRSSVGSRAVHPRLPAPPRRTPV